MTRADLIAILLAAALLPLLYIKLWQANAPAAQAHISDHQHNRTIARLDKDQTLHVHGKLGDSVLQVAQGKVRFIQSPCTGKFCVHSGWLRHSGEVMACLPNGVFVELVGGERRFDSINF